MLHTDVRTYVHAKLKLLGQHSHLSPVCSVRQKFTPFISKGSIVKFWPNEEGESVKYGRCTVQLLSSVDMGSFSVNSIELLLYSEVCVCEGVWLASLKVYLPR